MTNYDMTKRIWQFAAKYKWSFIGSYAVLLAELAFDQFLPVLLGEVVNYAVYVRDIPRFLLAAGNYALVFLGFALCGYVQLQLWQRVHNKYVYDIRVACYRKVLRLKPQILTDIKTGDVLQTINSDTGEFHHIIQRYMMRIVNAGIGTIVSLVIVAFMKWEIAVFMGLVIPVSALLSKRIESRIKKASDQVREKQGLYSAWVMEILKGMREVRLFAAEKTVLRLFMRKNHQITREAVKRDTLEFQAKELISGIYFAADMIFYIICAVFVINGSINIGQYVAIGSYFSMITYSVKRVLYGNVDYQRRKTCIERVLRLLDEEEEEAGTDALVVSRGRIQIRDLSFSYDGEREILKDINLDIKPGEKLGIAGPSGVGKSTLGGLLLKFYVPSQGRILIDGTDIRNCSPASVRQAVGIVSQENIIFQASVRENITFGMPASDEQLWNILEKVHMKAEIQRLPKGLDTVLESDGISLSGGQNQRLCIARLYFRDPKIIILDEATSALDGDSERIVQEALLDLTRGKTTVMISHRYQSLLHTDRILVLQDGRPVGCDSCDRLMSDNSYFRDLFAKQKEGAV